MGSGTSVERSVNEQITEAVKVISLTGHMQHLHFRHHDIDDERGKSDCIRPAQTAETNSSSLQHSTDAATYVLLESIIASAADFEQASQQYVARISLSNWASETTAVAASNSTLCWPNLHIFIPVAAIRTSISPLELTITRELREDPSSLGIATHIGSLDLKKEITTGKLLGAVLGSFVEFNFILAAALTVTGVPAQAGQVTMKMSTYVANN